MYYRGEGVEKNDKIALKWLKKAAEQGHINAKNFLESIREI